MEDEMNSTVVVNQHKDARVTLPWHNNTCININLTPLAFGPEMDVEEIANKIAVSFDMHDELYELAKELHWIVHAHMVNEEGDELLRRIDAIIPGLVNPYDDSIEP
jgi:hypothetical protein